MSTSPNFAAPVASQQSASPRSPRSPQQAYDGLEVAYAHDGLEATPVESHHYPGGPGQPQVYDGQDEGQYLQPYSAAPLDPTKLEAEAAAAAAAATSPPPTTPSQAEGGDAGKTKTVACCGLSRRTFWIVVTVAAIVIIAAIVGGVVGGLSSAGMLGNGDSSNGGGDNNRNLDPGIVNSNGSTGSVAIHGESKLAASNWTDSSGVNHRIVYFQDEYSHIVGRHWDDSASKWSTINITESVGISDQAPLAMAGTSLTSVASDYKGACRNHVFYQDDSSDIYLMGTSDAAVGANSWADESFGSQRPTAYYRSQMGATFQGCGSGLQCPGYFMLAYVDGSQGITVTNSTGFEAADWSWDVAEQKDASDVAPGTPLAMVPLRFRRPESVNFLYETPDSDLDHCGNYNYTTWADRTDLMTLEPVSSGGITQQLAGIKFDGGLSEMILSLQSGGTVQGFWWSEKYSGWNDEDKSWQSFTEVPFADYEPDTAPQFTAIATAMGGFFYGITRDGQILEFQNRQEAGNEGLFRYNSTVY